MAAANRFAEVLPGRCEGHRCDQVLPGRCEGTAATGMECGMAVHILFPFAACRSAHKDAPRVAGL